MLAENHLHRLPFCSGDFDGYNDDQRRQQCHSDDRDDCINRREYTGQPTQP